MKQFLLLFLTVLTVTILMAACGPDRRYQIEYLDGKVEYAINPRHIDADSGDTVIVQENISRLFSSPEVYGHYRGVIPKPIIDSNVVIVFNQVIVLK